MQAGKDLLDRYANLSPKVHVQYVDLLQESGTGAERPT